MGKLLVLAILLLTIQIDRQRECVEGGKKL